MKHPLSQRYISKPDRTHPSGYLSCRGCNSVKFGRYYRFSPTAFRKYYQRKLSRKAHYLPDLILVALRSRPNAARQLANLLHVGIWSTSAWIRGGRVKDRFRVKQVVAAVELGLIVPRTENVAQRASVRLGGAL